MLLCPVVPITRPVNNASFAFRLNAAATRLTQKLLHVRKTALSAQVPTRAPAPVPQSRHSHAPWRVTAHAPFPVCSLRRPRTCRVSVTVSTAPPPGVLKEVALGVAVRLRGALGAAAAARPGAVAAARRPKLAPVCAQRARHISRLQDCRSGNAAVYESVGIMSVGAARACVPIPATGLTDWLLSMVLHGIPYSLPALRHWLAVLGRAWEGGMAVAVALAWRSPLLFPKHP